MVWENVGIALGINLLLLGAWRILLRHTPLGDFPLVIAGCGIAWLLSLSLHHLMDWPTPYLLLAGGIMLAASLGLAGAYGWAGMPLRLAVTGDQSALHAGGVELNTPFVEKQDEKPLYVDKVPESTVKTESEPDFGGIQPDASNKVPEIKLLEVKVIEAEVPEVDDLYIQVNIPVTVSEVLFAEPGESWIVDEAVESADAEPALVDTVGVYEQQSTLETEAGPALEDGRPENIKDLQELIDDAFRRKAGGDLESAVGIFEQALELKLSKDDELFIVMEMCALYEMMEQHDEAFQRLIGYWERHRGHLAPHVMAEIENYLRLFRASRAAVGTHSIRRTAV